MKHIFILFFLFVVVLFGTYFLPIYTKMGMNRSQVFYEGSISEEIKWEKSRSSLKIFFQDLKYNDDYEKTQMLKVLNIAIWLGVSVVITFVLFFIIQNLRA